MLIPLEGTAQTVSLSGPSTVPAGGTATYDIKTYDSDGNAESDTVTVWVAALNEPGQCYENELFPAIMSPQSVETKNGSAQATLRIRRVNSEDCVGVSFVIVIDATRQDNDAYDQLVVTIGSSSNGDTSNGGTSNGGTSGGGTSGGGTSGSDTSGVGASQPLEPTVLSIVSGNNQSGLTGEALTDPLVVEVRDQYDDPMAGVTVTFTVRTGGGTLSATIGTTDANGQAQTTLTLGSELGTNTVEVRVEGVAETETFSAEAVLPPPVPTSLSIVSGDNQTGVIGAALANPFVVEVRDQRGDPMASATVTFAVTAGGGTLSAGTATTDANGRAESTLTLGADPGANTVTASVEGISQAETFSAEATTPPPTPTTLQTVSGGEQDESTVQTSMDPFVVEVIDQDGNPLEDVPVTFTILEPDGSMSTTTGTTDENGRAEITLPPGSDPGTYTVTASVEGIAETVTFTVVVPLEFDLTLPPGLNLIHIPLKVRTVDGMPANIKSVSDLYDALGGVNTFNWIITHDPQTQTWHGYFGDADQGSRADRALTEEVGILASVKTPISVQLSGDALGMDGTSVITLNRGLNLVGLPLQDSRIMRVSDLFELEGLGNNIAIIVVTDNGEFKAVGRADDDGDIAITGGSAFILIASEAATVPISGDGWDNTAAGAMAAPPLTRVGIQTEEITPVLTLSGSVVNGVSGINSADLRVTIKNASTGSEVATVIQDTDDTASQVGYRLTVVDIESGHVASIGDTLEISVSSPDVSIGSQPLRYTLTAEDVRRSRVELPALFLQEIPGETKLLRNYPNPFNPETWIPYRLAEEAFVTLTIYDSSGEIVRTLDVGHKPAAIYESRSQAAYWDGRNNLGESVASGMYFYTLTADDFSATRKMLILK